MSGIASIFLAFCGSLVVSSVLWLPERAFDPLLVVFGVWVGSIGAVILGFAMGIVILKRGSNSVLGAMGVILNVLAFFFIAKLAMLFSD